MRQLTRDLLCVLIGALLASGSWGAVALYHNHEVRIAYIEGYLGQLSIKMNGGSR